MKKLTLLFILSLSLSFLYAKEITVSVGAGQHWKEKREPQFSVFAAGTHMKRTSQIKQHRPDHEHPPSGVTQTFSFVKREKRKDMEKIAGV